MTAEFREVKPKLHRRLERCQSESVISGHRTQYKTHPAPLCRPFCTAQPHRSPQGVVASAVCVLPNFPATRAQLRRGPQNYPSLAPWASPYPQAGSATNRLKSWVLSTDPPSQALQAANSVGMFHPAPYFNLRENHLWHMCFLPLPTDTETCSPTCCVPQIRRCCIHLDINGQ